MSKSKKRKPAEQIQESIVDVSQPENVSRETGEFIPDGEFSEESKLIEQQPEENSGQAEATIEGEGSMISNVDEVEEANKPSTATKPKPLSWAERLEARNAERARRQEEWQQRIQDKKDQMQGK